MNWLIWEKMFTYFYNKFKPVNCMHCIKCLKSSLLTEFWLMQEFCGTYDYCFIMTHSIHNRGDLQFTLVWYSAKKGTTLGPLSHLARLCTVPYLWLRDKHRQQRSWVDDFTGQCWLWRLSSRTTFVAATLGLPSNLGVGRCWVFPASSVKFLTWRSLKSWWVYLPTHEDNSIQLLSSVISRRWRNSFVVHLKVRWPIK